MGTLAALLELGKTVLEIEVDPTIAPRGTIHLGDADAVDFVATAPCTLEFEGDLIFGVDSLVLEKGSNGPFDVVVEKGGKEKRDKCKVKHTAAPPQEIIVP